MDQTRGQKKSRRHMHLICPGRLRTVIERRLKNPQGEEKKLKCIREPKPLPQASLRHCVKAPYWFSMARWREAQSIGECADL